MSFLLKTPIRKSFHVHRDANGNFHSITSWQVSTGLFSSYTQTRANAARIIWERNAE